MRFILGILFAVSAFGQTGGALQPVPLQQPLDNAGRTLQGQCLYTYAAGTTTPQATYSNAALSVPNTNPIIINGFGREPAVYLSAVSYKIVLAYATTPGNCPVSPGTVIWSQDNVYDFGELLKVTLAASGGAALIGMQQPGGNLSTVQAEINSLGINDYAYSSLSAACSAASGTNLNLSHAWVLVATTTCLAAAINPIAGGSIQPGSGQVFTTPCPATVPFAVFDISAGGVNSVKFNAPCAGPVNIRMFTAPGGDWGLSLQAAYNACQPIGGCAITYPPGTFANATKFTLNAGEPVQISGAGGGTYTSTTVAPTLITYSGSGAWFNQNINDKTDNVVLHDFGYTCSATSCQFMQIGDFAENDDPAFYRLFWSMSNIWALGATPTTSTALPGMSLTHLTRLQMTNMTILNFYQDAVFDRTNAVEANSIFFQNYTVGPLITWKAGSGAGTVNGAEFTGINLGFQGPNYGSGNYSVTWDQQIISCTRCLYEPTVTSLGWMHNTGQAHNFIDTFGLMSGIAPTNSFVWDNPVAIQFIATQSNFAPTPPISSGAPANVPYGSPATFIATSSPLYTQCLALGNIKCQALGGTPYAYGGYTAITGPVRVDLTGSGDSYSARLMKNGATNDIQSINFVMPSADQATQVFIQAYAHTEAAGTGTVAAGFRINTGDQSSTALTADFAGNGLVSFPRYVGSTGSAGGKNVVCMDAATGTLYLSSTGTDCSN